MTQQLFTLPIGCAEDVSVLRRSGCAVAAALGYEGSSQVRFATALSELGREALLHGTQSSMLFSMEPEGALLVEIADFPKAGTEKNHEIGGFEAASKLLGDITVLNGAHAESVSLTFRRVPAARAKADAEHLREAVRRMVGRKHNDELRVENHALISTLNELKERQEQLLQLNGELEETNRGVMAMYTQLAGELEETNRGVVALYAELDEKSARLNQASEAKSRFLANASHELRSPVNSIIGLVRLLLESQGDEPAAERDKQLRFVLKSANELLRLINELLDLAKAESGRLDPECTVVDLAAVFADLRDSLKPLARPGVQLLFEEPQAAHIWSDQTLLMQILRNLIINALKFTQEGIVRVTAREVAENTVELAVTDTGIGIAPENQTSVFEEFFQVRGPLQVAHKGSGLGLPYVRKITEALHGIMSMESREEMGSMFTVRFPIANDLPQGVLHTPAAGAAVPTNLGTVLIADDDAVFRTGLHSLLKSEAREVIEAIDGKAALSMLRETRVHFVFIDLNMPEMDGLAFLREMRSDPGLRNLPVVMVTAAELTGDEEARLRKKMAAYLKKPANDRQALRRAVDEAFELVRVSA